MLFMWTIHTTIMPFAGGGHTELTSDYFFDTGVTPTNSTFSTNVIS